MKKVFSLLAVSFTSTNSQTVFADQPSFETNLQSQNSSLIPQYRAGRFRMNHWKYVTQGTWEGRAEFYNGTLWGTICDDFFNIDAADVFCRSFNQKFRAVSWTNVGNLPYNRSNDFSDGVNKPILMDDVSCSRNETSLN